MGAFAADSLGGGCGQTQGFKELKSAANNLHFTDKVAPAGIIIIIDCVMLTLAKSLLLFSTGPGFWFCSAI